MQRGAGWLVLAAVLLVAAADVREPVRAREQASAAALPAELSQVRLASDRSAPKVEKQSLPAYPANLTPDGVIEIDVVVGTDGRAVHTRVSKAIAGAPGLEHACLESLAAWRFQAASIGGRKVPSLVSVHFEFLPGAQGRAGRVNARLKLLPRVAPPARETLSHLEVVNLMQLPGTPPVDSGLVYPSPVRRVLPEYTRDAVRERIQGSVELEIVILPDGTVGAASIRRSLDSKHGLDGEALIAARYWTFTPATRHHGAIAVTSRLVLDFGLE